MLKLNEKDIFNEIRDSEEVRDKVLECNKKVLECWLSDCYRSDLSVRYTLENYTDSYLRFVTTQVVQERPQVSVSPESDANDTATAEGMEGAVNYWIKREQYKKTLSRMVRDIVLGWGVTMVYYDIQAGEGAAKAKYESDSPLPAKVCVKTIAPGQYFVDSRCYGYENRRIEGHCFDTDLEDLRNNPDYDQKVIMELKPNEDTKEMPGSPIGDFADRISKRERITVYEAWIPEANLLVTMARQGEREARILKVAPYEGPPEGPYTLWGTIEVPGQIYPYSIAAATFAQQDDLNLHTLAMQKNANGYKSFGVYQKSAADDGKAVQKVRSGSMIGLSQPDTVKMMEMGGISDTQVKMVDILRDRLDRNMGYSDAQRGLANSETATANNLAQKNSDHRMELLRQAIVAGAEADLRKVGWYFWNREDINMSFSTENRMTGQSETVEMYGGPFSDEELSTLEGGRFASQAGKNWSDYHLEIKVDSMNRVTDPIRQKRAIEEFQLVTQTLIPLVGVQGVNLRRALDRYGNAFNEPQLSQVYLTPMADQMIPPDHLLMQGQDPMQQPAGVPQTGPAEYSDMAGGMQQEVTQGVR